MLMLVLRWEEWIVGASLGWVETAITVLTAIVILTLETLPLLRLASLHSVTTLDDISLEGDGARTAMEFEE